MENQKSLSSPEVVDIPEKWKPRYLIKRIDEEDIRISSDDFKSIVEALKIGLRYVMVKGHILMLNSLKSVDPVWRDNIPPCPEERLTYQIVGNTAISRVSNQDEIDEWNKYFGSSKRRLLE